MYVSFIEMKEQIKKGLMSVGLSEEQAEICAQVHTESSQDGIESHGLNRVPRFMKNVRRGWIKVEAKMECFQALNSIEHYDGGQGIGIINAHKATQRAIDLAATFGMGIVCLKNTTHWMRGGTYAWDMVNAGYMGICWSNSESCMPAWGSDRMNIGNNPFCMGIPDQDTPLVLDMAMSQFSYGKLHTMHLANQLLPFAGGYDAEGKLTVDPKAIQDSGRLLPMGFWKGSGFAIMLDLFVSILANGYSTAKIDQIKQGSGTGCSQIFLVFDPYLTMSVEAVQAMIQETIQQIHQSSDQKELEIYYPGERTLKKREATKEQGIYADDTVWERISSLTQEYLK